MTAMLVPLYGPVRRFSTNCPRNAQNARPTSARMRWPVRSCRAGVGVPATFLTRVGADQSVGIPFAGAVAGVPVNGVIAPVLLSSVTIGVPVGVT